MVAIEGDVLPAYTAVIVETGKGSYKFNYGSTHSAYNGENNLGGTLVNTIITPAANEIYYILGVGSNGIGLYQPALEEAEGANNGKIYDITGREVKVITAPGLYIINGKKVVIK